MTMKKHASFSGARLLLCLLALILFGCSAAAYLLDTRISESTYAYVGKHTSGVGHGERRYADLHRHGESPCRRGGHVFQL